MAKYHFIIIGSGWRALYYVRVAKALPEIFSLDAMYCRTQEKADLIAGQYQIHTTTSIEECVAYKPDFAVVAVKKDAICDVSMEWLDRGITVLSETPAALDTDSLNKLYSYYKCGKKQVVAEQYREYPNIKASLKLINEGIIGDVSCVNVSLAHEYHGISLIRAFLGVNPGEKYTVSAKTYEFPTTQTLTRYDKFTDGRIAGKKRCVATFEFESGKVAWYDFDSEQYRSPIRKNTLKVQGVRGELIDDCVYYLDENNEGQTGRIITDSHVINTGNSNPNFEKIREIKKNQRIIAGNAQFTGIAAGRGVGFTTGLLLLREGLGMRETPIRPRLSIWRKQKETPGVEKAPGVSSPQRKESGRSGRDDGELRFWVRPGHPYKAVTSISQTEALAHGLTHLHHLVFAAVLARELDWCAALQDAREDARPWGVVGIGLRSDVWVEVRRDDHRPAVLVTRVDDVVDMPHDVIGAAVRPQVVDDEEVILEEARLRVLALVERHRLDVGHDVLHAGLQRGEPEVDDPVGDCRGIERLTCAHLSPEEQPIHVIA